MDYSKRMQELNGLNQLQYDLPGSVLSEPELSGLKIIEQVASPHVFEDEVEIVGTLEYVDEFDDIRVFAHLHDFDLLLDLIHLYRLDVFLAHNLYGGVLPGLLVHG